MKNTMKKVLALTLALAMCLTLIPAALAVGNADSTLAYANRDNNFDYLCSSVEFVDAGAEGAVFSKTYTATGYKSGYPIYAAILPVDASGNSLNLGTRYVRLDTDGTLTYFRTGCRYFAVQLVQPEPDAGDGTLGFSAVTNGSTVELDCISTLNMSEKMAIIVDAYKDHRLMDEITYSCHIRFSTDKIQVNASTIKLESKIFEIEEIRNAADGYGFDIICRLKDGWKNVDYNVYKNLVDKLCRTMTLTADAAMPATEETFYATGWIKISNVPDPVLNSTTFQVPMVTIATAVKPVTPVQPSTDDPSGVSRYLETGAHNTFMSGYPDGSFGPDKGIKRCEVAQMFYNLLINKNVPITASFKDVNSGDWFYTAVTTLASMGIITGRSDGSFDPQAGITRAEFAAIAARFANAVEATASFTDVASDHWALKYIATASHYGWVTGYANGNGTYYFAPNKGISRCEAATIVNRMLGRAADPNAMTKGARTFTDVPSSHWAYLQIAEATTAHTYSKDTGSEIWN